MSDMRHVVCPHCDAVNRIPADRLAAGPNCGKCHEVLFAGRPTELGEKSFDKHIGRNDIPVVVDFWAPWCGPCKMMAPHFDKAASQLEPNVRLAKVNTDEAQSLAARHRIQGIPTIAVFKDGKEVARQSGAMGGGDLVRWVQSNV